MGKVLINKHNFEIAKSNIQRFSRNLPSNPSFTRVEVDGGLFGLGNHKVTGAEMNAFIGVVQDKLISVNLSLKSIINEFKEVYNAFDSLDGEYISGIIGSVECAEEASKQALQAQADIKEAVEKLRKTVVGLVNLKTTVECIEKKVNTNYTSLLDRLSSIDAKIDKTKDLFSLVNSQKERNDILNKLFSQLSSNLHYKDIDVIWNDVECQKKGIASIHQQIDNLVRNVNQVIKSINNNISMLQQYQSILESYKHLRDIDTIWSDVEKHKDFHQQVDNLIVNINRGMEHMNNNIVVIQQYCSVLKSYEHLGDVDIIWNDVEKLENNLDCFHQQVDNFIENINQETESIKNNIISLQQYRSMLESYKHLNDIDSIWDDVEKYKIRLTDFRQFVDKFISEVHTSEYEIKDYIQKMKDSNKSAHLLYEKKIKIAYSFGGTAIGLSIINFILQILGVL